ncbi:DoxX family protein [Novosphingobium sp. Chol11]|uniref:DoxX family protein n=1 Tax=Novosphingobium sp. Chol11 TaxID=1385763 RepID=UPI000BE29A2F|nr:DoxX family protein [Novosphingobium sp. Chol11]
MAHLRTALAWLLGAFFVIGGVTNLLASEGTQAQYATWGYPDWFHYVTAGLEFGTAALLFVRKSRILGAVLGVLVMCAAAGTLIRNGEYVHAIIPGVVLVLLVITGRSTLRHQRWPILPSRETNPWEGEED